MSSPEWTELCLEIAVEDTDRAAAIANMAVPYGIYIEDYSDLEQGARDIARIDLIDEELLARDRTRALIHLYISPEDNPAEAAAYLRERLTAEGIRHELAAQQVKEEDWANGWKQYFKPLPVGERLLIRPTWEEAGDPGGRQVLSIDPGMAFGTGGHDTTRLVLETLEELVFPGAELLDVGCGSGILSIAALLLGAARTVGVDIDPLAVKTAEENGRLNGFAPPRYVVKAGDLARDVEGVYDVVAANIVADAIIALSPQAPRFLKPGGVYVMSGIIDTREEEVLTALERSGLRLTGRKERKGWLCLTARLQ